MKKQIAYVIAATLAISAVVPIMAADNIKTRDAQLRSDFTIVVEGKEVGFRTADGQAVYPVLYNGSTYLPLRAVGELMGKNVNWDEKNKVVTLSGTRDSISKNDVNAKIGKKDIRVQERPDFTIVVDNEKKKFRSATGREIYPILYNGSTYLPLRAIGEIMEQDVIWDGKEKKITLGTKNGDFTVTDADSFQQNDQANVPNNNTITREKAKEIALDHAGLSATQVTFAKTKMDTENGKLVYEIEFYAGNKEYDYEIDAHTGKIISYDFDAESYAPPTQPTQQITREKAKEIALDHAKLSPSQVKFVKVKQDMENGISVYEIEFYAGNKEYDYEIDARTGKIISYDFDAESYTPSTNQPGNGGKITLEKAKEIALQHAGLNGANVRFTKTKQEFDDGITKYEIEFFVNGVEHEFEISASGKVIEYSADND